MNADKYCVSEAFVIKEVMETFHTNNNRVAFVVNDEKKVVGAVSQGDIIRALIYGNSELSSVTNIMVRSFAFLFERDMQKAYAIFKENQITLLPIIDEKFRIVDVVTLLDIFEYLEEGVHK